MGHSPWQDVYNPQRSLKLNAVGKLISLNADVAKELVWGKLSAAESGEILGRQEAKVVEVHGRKAGAYRDEEGRLHVVDNTCTHLGCGTEVEPRRKDLGLPLPRFPFLLYRRYCGGAGGETPAPAGRRSQRYRSGYHIVLPGAHSGSLDYFGRDCEINNLSTAGKEGFEIESTTMWGKSQHVCGRRMV